MPLLADLQKTMQQKSIQRKVIEQSWDDERLIVDERSGRSSSNLIEEKLSRLLLGGARSGGACSQRG